MKLYAYQYKERTADFGSIVWMNEEQMKTWSTKGYELLGTIEVQEPRKEGKKTVWLNFYPSPDGKGRQGVAFFYNTEAEALSAREGSHLGTGCCQIEIFDVEQ